MTDTTSIDDLPTDPISGNQNNITIQKMEMNNGMRGNQIQQVSQVYSPNISGINMSGSASGSGMGIESGIGMSEQHMQGQVQGQLQGQHMMNELVNGLQKASASGMTNLPSRDIPMNTMNMMSDAQVKPNYVPPMPPKEEFEDYINRHDKDMINEEVYNKQVNREDTMENIYKMIQIPLLVSVLYFAFQLPIFRKYILKYIPSVFNADGNYNISGLVFISSLFGLSYFGLTKILDSVSV